jgi:sugar O-acyltransferase (sialic acid O-acetyltransferase NeuD family)
MLENIFLLGSSGHARVVADIIERSNNYHICFIFDDMESLHDTQIFGYHVIGGRKRLLLACRYHNVNTAIVTIGDNRTRSNLHSQLQELGISFGKAIHPSAQIGTDVIVSEGTVIMANVVINPGVNLGRGVILNTKSSVDHDCQVGDFSHLGPGCTLCGGVKIHQGVFLGAGVTVIPNIIIGPHAVVGAGSTVIDNLAEGAVVVGSPARKQIALKPPPPPRNFNQQSLQPQTPTISYISVKEIEKWNQALRNCGHFDIFHTTEFHRIDQLVHAGDAYLFAFDYLGHFAALPIVVRPINLSFMNSELKDITSVYGYPGPITSVDVDSEIAEEFKKSFQSSLQGFLKKAGFISLFSRTNPFYPAQWLLDEIAEIEPLSSLVTINLLDSDEDYRRNMSKGHRYDIRRAATSGVTVEEDKDFSCFPDFVSLYNETMHRVHASSSYFFTDEYYLNLRQELGDGLKLFIARQNDVIISAALFIFSNGIIHYYLSGSSTAGLTANGAKMIIDTVRNIGKRMSYRIFNLGGGVGSSEDDLFRFKAGFSKSRVPFSIIKMIIDRDQYTALCTYRQFGAEMLHSYYFPAYRASLP